MSGNPDGNKAVQVQHCRAFIEDRLLGPKINQYWISMLRHS